MPGISSSHMQGNGRQTHTHPPAATTTGTTTTTAILPFSHNIAKPFAGAPKQRQAPVLSLATCSSAQLHAGPDKSNTMEHFCHAVAYESMSDICTYRFMCFTPLCLSAALCRGDIVTVATNYFYRLMDRFLSQ